MLLFFDSIHTFIYVRNYIKWHTCTRPSTRSSIGLSLIRGVPSNTNVPIYTYIYSCILQGVGVKMVGVKGVEVKGAWVFPSYKGCHPTRICLYMVRTRSKIEGIRGSKA
jgi:hypothetical protein